MTTSIANAPAVAAPARAVSLLAVAFLGAFMVGVAGFLPMSVAHNAAHDYRHSVAFPCH